jgi:integrase/recombinase XerC
MDTATSLDAGTADGHGAPAYLAWLKTERKLSAHTLAAYGRDLAVLQALAGERTLAALVQAEIRRFAAKLHGQGLGPRSIARHLSSWRGYYLWLAQRAPLAANPVDGIKAPRREKSLPKALSADDAVRLVAAAPVVSGTGLPSPTQLCNRAMFELLYSSGLRVSELAGLDCRHTQSAGYASQGWLNAANREVTVTGKGNKMRTVPVGGPALEALAAWLAVRDRLARQGDEDGAAALFLTERGTRISPRLIQQRLKAHGQALDIPARVHPHVLRHSFASHVLQSSGDLRAVQDMLGHASIASTQVYTALDFQRLAAVYDSAHPRAKKKPG